MRSSLVIASLVLASTTSAFADGERPAPPAVPLYTAPLSQTVQGTYVPQSVALSGPDEISDDTDERAVPAGYTVVHRRRKGLLIGGGVTLGVAYTYSLLFAAAGEDSAKYSASGRNEMAAMWIPVAGPFIQMGNTDSATMKVLVGGLGAAQLAGAVMLYYGMTTTKRVYVRNDLVGNLTVSPMVSDRAQGMMIGGRF